MTAWRRLGWVAMGWLATPGVALAQQTLVVSQLGAGDFLTIQDAVDGSADGDTIVVTGGIYVEAVSISGRDLTLSVADGDVVTIRGPFGVGASVVDLSGGANVMLEGFQIDGAGSHRGISAGDQSVVLLSRVEVINGVNADGYAGGSLDVWGGASVVAANTSFRGGLALTGYWPLGGNVAVEYGSQVALGQGVVVEDGWASRGGGLWVGYAASADVNGATFLDNVAVGYTDNDGGGICAESGSALGVTGAHFTNNQAGMDNASSGGAIFTWGGQTVVTESTFSLGRAHLGGGVASMEGILLVAGSTFTDNSADKGGAVGCDRSLVCAVLQSRLENNDAIFAGGGVYAYRSTTTVSDSEMCGNSASYPGGGQGGAVGQDTGSLLVNDVVFANNVAATDGGAVSVSDAPFTSRNNSLLANHATDGGGGAYYHRDNAAAGHLPSSVNDLFLSNTAFYDGAVSFLGAGSVTWSLFWLSAPDDGTFPASLTNVFQDPLIVGWTPGSCALEGITFDGGSPVVNGGDPATIDANGTRADIGARPGGDANAVGDDDGDGLINFLDCDPLDPTIDWTVQRWYPDLDQDSYGDHTVWVDDCDQPAGHVLLGGDCDDTNPYLNPETWWFYDGDGDGLGDPYTTFQACAPYNGVTTGDDCDDRDPYVGAPRPFFVDQDGDKYGSEEERLACELTDGLTDLPGDCAPDNPYINPEALETCDGVDQDCDGVADNDPIDGFAGYADADGDGFGDPATWVSGCDPTGLVEDGTDCDDTDDQVFPGAPDAWYDGVDSDCDGRDDLDQDGDGAGKATDCDDTDPAIFPGAEDVLDDGVDGDCDGVEARSWIGGSGCACDGTASGAGWLAWLPMLIAVGRRRARG